MIELGDQWDSIVDILGSGGNLNASSSLLPNVDLQFFAGYAVEY